MKTVILQTHTCMHVPSTCPLLPSVLICCVLEVILKLRNDLFTQDLFLKCT